jgi:hypothetical protein
MLLAVRISVTPVHATILMYMYMYKYSKLTPAVASRWFHCVFLDISGCQWHFLPG